MNPQSALLHSSTPVLLSYYPTTTIPGDADSDTDTDTDNETETYPWSVSISHVTTVCILMSGLDSCTWLIRLDAELGTTDTVSFDPQLPMSYLNSLCCSSIHPKGKTEKLYFSFFVISSPRYIPQPHPDPNTNHTENWNIIKDWKKLSSVG